jgi:hypothetical protein
MATGGKKRSNTGQKAPAKRIKGTKAIDLVLPELFDQDGLELHLNSVKKILLKRKFARVDADGWTLTRQSDEVTGLCLKTLKGDVASVAHQMAGLYEYDWSIVDMRLREELLSPTIVRAKAQQALHDLKWDGHDAVTIESFLRNLLKLTLQFNQIYIDKSEQRKILKTGISRLPAAVQEKVNFYLRVTHRKEPEDCEVPAVISAIRDVSNSLPQSDRVLRVGTPATTSTTQFPGGAPMRRSGRRDWLRAHHGETIIFVKGSDGTESVRAGRFGHTAEFKDKNFSGEEFSLFSFAVEGETKGWELVNRLRGAVTPDTVVRPWNVRPERNFQ